MVGRLGIPSLPPFPIPSQMLFDVVQCRSRPSIITSASSDERSSWRTSARLIVGSAVTAVHGAILTRSFPERAASGLQQCAETGTPHFGAERLSENCSAATNVEAMGCIAMPLRQSGVRVRPG